MLGEFMLQTARAMGAMFGGSGVFFLYAAWYSGLPAYLEEAGLFLGIAVGVNLLCDRKACVPVPVRRQSKPRQEAAVVYFPEEKAGTAKEAIIFAVVVACLIGFLIVADLPL